MATRRPPRRVLISGNKGGVGKTTVALNLAAHVTGRGRRVLVVELDPQANATNTVARLYPDQIDRSLADVLVEVAQDRDPAEAVRDTVLSAQDPTLELDELARSAWGRLDVLPSSPDVAGLRLESQHYWDLSYVLDSVEDDYDLILLDSAPSISTLTTLGAYACDTAIAVTEPAENSIAGVRQFRGQMIDQVRRYHGIRLAGVLVNKVDARLEEHRYQLEQIRQGLPDLFCRAFLPRRTIIEKAEGRKLPVRALSERDAVEVADLYAKVYRYLITNTRREG